MKDEWVDTGSDHVDTTVDYFTWLCTFKTSSHVAPNYNFVTFPGTDKRRAANKPLPKMSQATARPGQAVKKEEEGGKVGRSP